MQFIRLNFSPLEVFNSILIALSLLRSPQTGEHFTGWWSDGEGKELRITRSDTEFGIYLTTPDRYRKSQATLVKDELQGLEVGTIGYLHETDQLLIRGEKWDRMDAPDLEDEKGWGQEQSPIEMPTGVNLEAGPEGIFPDSSDQLIDETTLQNLDQKELELVGKEIFARHGLIFTDVATTDFFEQFSWYRGWIRDPKWLYSRFNETELNNLAMIQHLMTGTKGI